MPAPNQAISYALTINGSPAPPALMSSLQALQVEDHAELPDLLRLRVTIGVTPDGRGWSVLDEDLFPRLSPIKLTARIGSTSETLINAYVVETHVDFGTQPGQTVFTMVAMDPTVLMNLEEKIRPWPDMTDSDIASVIFGEYGFTANVEDTQPARPENEQRTTQRGTDIQFLQQLAKRNGYECYVETSSSGEVEGHFHPPDTTQKPQGVLTVNMGESTNVSSFRVKYDMLRPVTAKVQGLEAESLSKQPAESAEQKTGTLGSGGTVAADRPRIVLLAGTGLNKAGELQSLAQSVVDRSSWAVLADGELNTATYGSVLRAKRPVSVRGIGRALSGTYYVERVLHTLTGGTYSQRFTLRRNATGLSGQETFTEDNAL